VLCCAGCAVLCFITLRLVKRNAELLGLMTGFARIIRLPEDWGLLGLLGLLRLLGLGLLGLSA
jgi:hypothetical protein